MKNCPKCNASLPDDAIYCFDCGENVANVAQAPLTAETQVQQADEIPPQEYYQQPDKQFADNSQYADAQPVEAAQFETTPAQEYQPTMQQSEPVMQQDTQFTMDEVQPVVQDLQPTMDEVQPVINNAYTQQGYTAQNGYYGQSQGGYQQNYTQPAGSYYDQQSQGYQQSGYYTQPQVTSQQFGNFAQPQQPDQFNTPDYINPASPNMPGVTPGKGGSSLIVPIILIILILAVIFIDVFWLFRDQIWGKDDSSTSAVSYITMNSDIQ